MARRTFSIGDEVTFPRSGEVASVAKIEGQGIPFHTVVVWLQFPDVDRLVAYTQNDLRKALRG